MDLSSPTLEATRARLAARFGARVQPWWERLPATVAELTARWDLAVGDAVGRGNTSLVVRCRRADGRPAMLKLTPEAELASAEGRALLHWQPSGHVPLVYEHDPALGALLLEAIASETPLADSPRGVETSDLAGLIAALQRAAEPHGFPSLAERIEFVFALWIERHAGNPAVPRVRLERGRDLARTLAMGGTPVLLHGDLHPGNVLLGTRGLVAIDPRPCVGDAAFDALDWVFWQADDPREWESRSRRLGVDAERLWSWCAAFAALLAAGERRTGRADALLRLAP